MLARGPVWRGAVSSAFDEGIAGSVFMRFVAFSLTSCDFVPFRRSVSGWGYVPLCCGPLFLSRLAIFVCFIRL